MQGRLCRTHNRAASGRTPHLQRPGRPISNTCSSSRATQFFPSAYKSYISATACPSLHPAFQQITIYNEKVFDISNFFCYNNKCTKREQCEFNNTFYGIWRNTQEAEEAPLLRVQVGQPARGFKSLFLRLAGDSRRQFCLRHFYFYFCFLQQGSVLHQ